jgi:hypothetical protein
MPKGKNPNDTATNGAEPLSSKMIKEIERLTELGEYGYSFPRINPALLLVPAPTQEDAEVLATKRAALDLIKKGINDRILWGKQALEEAMEKVQESFPDMEVSPDRWRELDPEYLEAFLAVFRMLEPFSTKSRELSDLFVTLDYLDSLKQRLAYVEDQLEWTDPPYLEELGVKSWWIKMYRSVLESLKTEVH